MNMLRRGPENGLRKLWTLRTPALRLSDLELNIPRFYMKCFSALCSFLFWYIF